MKTFQKILKGTSLLSGSEAVTYGCSLARNIILARFLGKADFGVAATLGMIISVFELASKMALGQQVVQSKYGDDPAFVSSVQFTHLALGTVSTLLILAFSWPLAHFLSGPQYLRSIIILAFVPFINGLTNLDLYRYARRFSFGPLVVTEIVPQVAVTLAAWPIAALFRDYRAVLCLLLGKAVLSASMTHVMAERRFSPRFDAHWLRESLSFGWPLLLSGFIQFGNFQGDSLVIAAAYPMAKLGEYSVAMTLAMAPGLMILRIGGSVSLPMLAEVQSDPTRFAFRYSQYAQTMALIGCSAMLCMLFCGEQVVVLLFGAKYAGVGRLACWLTGAQALRILRGATVAAAMAKGDTVNNLVSSSWRLSGLLVAIAVGLLKGSLTWFAVAGFVGEVAALGASVVRLNSKHSITPSRTLVPALWGAISVILAGALKSALSINPYSYVNWFILFAFLGLTAGSFMAFSPELRSGLSRFQEYAKGKLGLPFLAKAEH